MKNEKFKIRREDTVVILAGKDRGKKGRVERISRGDGKVVVSGVNMVKKHTKKTSKNAQGGRIEFPAPIELSNVMLVCPSCGKLTRVQVKDEGGAKVRVCRKCGKVIGGKSA